MIVHTPWKPGKAELARRERIRRRLRGIVYRLFHHHNENESGDINIDIGMGFDTDIKLPTLKHNESETEYYERLLKLVLGNVWDRHKNNNSIDINWNPTKEEMDQWDEKVLEITQKVEYEAMTKLRDQQPQDIATRLTNHPQQFNIIQAGLDRNGCEAKQYKESLPPFLFAASEGNLDFLKETIQHCINKNKDINDKFNMNKEIMKIIEERDRNHSIAEHWAAGGGHLDCLKYIFAVRDQYLADQLIISSQAKTKRKRDGKTCLHFAARNGHDHVIDFLLRNHKPDNDYPMKQNYEVDVESNDGTTPLHLACYGGHVSTIRMLITKYNADFLKINEWGCGVGHWIAMSVQSDSNQVLESIQFLKQYISKYNENNVSGDKLTTFAMFGLTQKQGHSAVHKAAQKLNRSVIEWLMNEAKTNWTSKQIQDAGLMDQGGNKPNGIWMAMGGDQDFALLMRELGW